MVTVLHERPEDARAIRFVLEEVFGQSTEADLIDALRRRGALILSLVALREDEVVGHIAFSPVTIESAESSFDAIGLGPMAVLPAYQGKGIGSELVRMGLKLCRQAGHEIVVVVGHPAFYGKFGFVSTRHRGLHCEFDVPADAFMVMELRQGALAGRGGLVKYQPEF
ncbi:MAG: GNAT family N-acetyltransferase, partial [Deltaproteobacteria bacterium]|nr:GNAT family N-acetyltransferase [Deltaproteobacteria bacterium]